MRCWTFLRDRGAVTTDQPLAVCSVHQERARFLSRLLHDRAANTLVIMAAALIPLSAFAGSAVDIGRLYVVKSRLQQACDAGVLVGRKFMTAGSSTTLDANASSRARDFFRNNFPSGWLNTRSLRFTPVKTGDQQVSGTASVTVPMTITKIMNAGDTTVSVACKARYDVADTDIIFVLDTTGSMACRPEDSAAQCNTYVQNTSAVAYNRPSGDPFAMPGYTSKQGYGVPETTSGTGSRMKALRQAVKDFHATLASSVDANTRIRYGFVSYTSIVNAGKAISNASPSFLLDANVAETANYQARFVSGDYTESYSSYTKNGKNQQSCTPSAKYTRDPAPTKDNPYTYRPSDSRATVQTQEWFNGYGCYDVTKIVGPQWTYREMPLYVSAFVKGSLIKDPTRVDLGTTAWEGCIEERQTEAGKYAFSPQSYDLDPELVPTSDRATRWKPAWPDVTYPRSNFANTAEWYSNGDDKNVPAFGTADRRMLGWYSCGKPIRTLTEMSAADVARYVDATDFKPIGGTYHDVGMIWGVRLLASKGIFAASNGGRTGQPSPKKIIVFLTDGDMAPSERIYGAYGTEYYDRRVSGGDTNNLKAYHNARFLYECRQAARLNIDVWTVALGLASTDELKQCASNEGQALATTTGSGLSTLFQKIAKQVAMLRLEK